VLHTFKASAAAKARMCVELRSREVLVAWVAYCMLHAAASRQHPILQQYGVGLRWEDLRHLVLGDRTACDALLAVAAYLQRHSKPGRAVFTLRDGGQATFSMAKEYAQGDTQIMATWKVEQDAAQDRREAHWQEVCGKVQQAESLQAVLTVEEEAEQAASEDLDSHFGEGRKKKKAALAAAKRARVSTEAQLSQALKSPDPVFQPLPRGEDAALTWLFFLYMPPMFR
jgi:hypothetical protein